MDTSEYAELPDSISSEELSRYFEEVLTYAEGPKCERDGVSTALYELADRQYHTYELIAKSLADRVSRWITAHWNPPSVPFAQHAAFISGALGLADVIEPKALSDQSIPSELRAELERAIRQVKPHASDPYSDLHGTRNERT